MFITQTINTMTYYCFVDQVLKLHGLWKGAYGECVEETFPKPLELTEGVFCGISIHIDDDVDCMGRIFAIVYDMSNQQTRIDNFSEESLDKLFEVINLN